MKKVLGSLAIAITILSCNGANNSTNSVSVDNTEAHALNNIKENILFESKVYAIYESKDGYKTVFIQEETLKDKAANPESKISSVITKDNKVVKVEEILNADMEKMYTEKIMNDIKADTKGLFMEDAKVDLKSAVVVLDGDNIVFVFPKYTIAPGSTGIPRFVYEYNK
ncbi:RsiV family protein [Oceanivirga salmonicida]|uniref:RsiV family protein n=1 Tax=Oceanivirga salmonicida TaxID=1769291 RepID=UPI00082EDB68|nr:RsiV family protein [Oceanivirga salmonicida]